MPNSVHVKLKYHFKSKLFSHPTNKLILLIISKKINNFFNYLLNIQKTLQFSQNKNQLKSVFLKYLIFNFKISLIKIAENDLIKLLVGSLSHVVAKFQFKVKGG